MGKILPKKIGAGLMDRPRHFGNGGIATQVTYKTLIFRLLRKSCFEKGQGLALFVRAFSLSCLGRPCSGMCFPSLFIGFPSPFFAMLCSGVPASRCALGVHASTTHR